MIEIGLSLLRGICQLPAHAAYASELFSEIGVAADICISPSASLTPKQLVSGAADFAVLPWTRVAAAGKNEAPLKIIPSSGFEETAIVGRAGLFHPD